MLTDDFEIEISAAKINDYLLNDKHPKVEVKRRSFMTRESIPEQRFGPCC